MSAHTEAASRVRRGAILIGYLAVCLGLALAVGEASAQDSACTFYKVNSRILNIAKDAVGDAYIDALGQGDVVCVSRQQKVDVRERGFISHKLDKTSAAVPVNGWATLRFLDLLSPAELAALGSAATASAPAPTANASPAPAAAPQAPTVEPHPRVVVVSPAAPVPATPAPVAVATAAAPAPAAAVAASNLRTRDGKRDCDSEACPEMIAVRPGAFTMGSPEAEKDREKDEGPQRRVTIPRPFMVSKFEVTFAEWDACVAGGGCKYRPGDEGWGRGTRPVINVSWNDIQEYIRWLSSKTGMPYRLLTEAEWEYAARAGSPTRYAWGDEVGEGNANCNGCKSEWGRKQTAPVGSFKANAFGLHDMHGNVWEWVQDCYGSYAAAPGDGAAAPEAGNCQRVIRGGSWYVEPGNLRAADRYRFEPAFRDDSLGFRVARVIPP